VTPSAWVSTTATSSPTATRITSANPAPSTVPAAPVSDPFLDEETEEFELV